MCRFIESICCEDGKVKLPELHQERVNRTFRKFFPAKSILSLAKNMNDLPPQGKYKCRIEYSSDDFKLEYIPYTAPSINTLKMVDGGEVDYSYKLANRETLTGLFELRDQADDILIVKNEHLTDSYFANLAFYDGSSWFTPNTPLLKGVKREQLIASGKLIPFDIKIGDLRGFQKVSLINALLDLEQVCVPIKNIKFL